MTTSQSTTIILPGERPTSWNQYYAGSHWAKRKAEVERVRMVVRAALTGNELAYDVPVDIIVVAYFDKQPQDSSNICDKVYEDAIKEWLIVDDSPYYVTSVKSSSRIDKENPRVELHLVPSRSLGLLAGLIGRLNAVLGPSLEHQLVVNVMKKDAVELLGILKEMAL